MLFLDARQVRVADRSDDFARLVDAEHAGQAEIRASLVALVVQAGLEGGQQRAAGIHVRAQLPALRVAEQGGVGQQQRRILLQLLGREFVLMHEIEKEAAFEQRIVHAVHVLPQHARVGVW